MALLAFHVFAWRVLKMSFLQKAYSFQGRPLVRLARALSRAGLVLVVGVGSLLAPAGFAGQPVPTAWANGGVDGVITLTTVADFSTCTALTGSIPAPLFNNVSLSPADGGELRLSATLEDYFDGPTLDTTRWLTGTVYEWYTVPPSLSNGVLVLDSAYLRSQTNFQSAAPRFFEARALQRADGNPAGWPDLGFYREQPPLFYGEGPYPADSALRLYVSRDDNTTFARGRDGDGNQPLVDIDLPVIDLTQYHLFRIEWDTTEARFYVDGVLQATIPGIATLNTWAFLYHQTPTSMGASPMHVDWVRTGQYASSGTYTSCAYDAGGIVNWTTLTATTSTPSGTSLAFEARTSVDGVAWSAWQAVTGGSIGSPSGRYFQYRVSLGTSAAYNSPEVAQVSVNYYGAATLQVSPAPATLDPGATQVFVAQALDSNSRAVTGLNTTWGLTNGGGTLGATGIFTAALPAGIFTNTVAATVTTTAGPVAGAASVIIRDLAPSVNIGGPYVVAEGATLGLSGSGQDPNGLPVTLSWDLDNNGTFETSGASATFSRPDNGVFTVGLRVQEVGGAGLATVVTTPVTVTNVAPVATITGAPGGSVPEGTAVTLGSTVTDVGVLDTHTYAWSVTKNGNAYGSGTGTGFTFTPDDNGTYVVSLSVADDDGGVGTASNVTVTVTNVAPAATITGAPGGSVPEGTAVTLGRTLTDPGTADTHAHAWSVTKNGSAYGGGTGTGFTFTPDDNGMYVVSLSVADDDGGVGTASNVTVTVTNVAPVVAITGEPEGDVPEGATVTLGRLLTDPGTADTHAHAWSVTKNGNAYGSGTGTTFTFTPDDNGTYVVSLSVTDDDGGVGTDTATFLAANAIPAVSLGADAVLNQGDALLRAGSFSDPGADTHSGAVNYGDGAGWQALSLSPEKAFTLSRSYFAVGVFTVTVVITDDDGAAGTDLLKVTWANVPPTIQSVTNSGPVFPGEGVTISVTATDPGGAGDPLAYAFDCNNDGLFEIGPQVAAQASCLTAAVGQQVVGVRVSDSLGGVAHATTEVQVGARVYLPLVAKSYLPVAAPDLVIDSLLAAAGQITVTVRNQGRTPAVDEFWVDFYVAPDPAPTGVNQVWNDGRSVYGAVWGVAAASLPLDPGETLVLTLGDGNYQPARSHLPGLLAAGTLVMAQVDSANTATSYGAVLETHEIAGYPYNNLAQISIATDTPLGLALPVNQPGSIPPARPQ